MKCVCFRRGPCVVQSAEYLCTNWWSVCVSGEGLVLCRAQTICAQTDEVCVFLEKALWKCVCFWRRPCGSVCVSGEGLVEVCVFLERALWKCVCFWREPCVVQICIPVQPRPAAASHHCVWLHLQDGHWLWGQAAAEDHDESQCYVGQYLPLTWGDPYLYRSTSL